MAVGKISGRRRPTPKPQDPSDDKDETARDVTAGPAPSQTKGIARAKRAALPLLLTKSDVARIVNASERTVSRWIENKDLIAHKFGGAVRISEDDFRAFLARHRGS